MDSEEVVVVVVGDPESPPVGSPADTNFDEVTKPVVEKKKSKSVALPDDLRHKIIKQVEYYFSDENLKTDTYLMNYVTKDKDGYVPISVIASFRKLKKLAPERSLIVAALKDSSQLVLSSSKKNVRRLNPLPFHEVRDPQLCTVLVENLPEDHSPENIRKIFCAAGSIKNISIRDPNVSRETKSCSVAEKLLCGKLHALVEYETVESAEKAVFTLNDERDWRYGMRVKLLKKQVKQGQRKPAWREAGSEKGSEKHSSARAIDSAGEKENHVSSEQHNDTPDDEEDGDHTKEKNGNRSGNRGRGRNQKYRSTNGLGHGFVHLNHVGETSKPPPGPRMPDGTRGFTMGRGRPLSVNQD
ncbi:Translation initiation factor eIF-2B subunit delta [Heracleum sosnowskyi]|uniref:Translation initiation factor eIF-2B subunit delta n=1 Tax=Heracleum sosnowskyi TaxID=360622 RepID=A0AAD8I4M2_9APIA|nr:Translation initiation factor eIF-2B subunit delta [Heracleum sosnowskyi]